MCRRSRLILHAMAVAIALSHALVGPAAGDDVASYLEQHGLRHLLAAHLEQQLDRAAPEDRGELILRLASIYSELLESVSDPVQRQSLEERSRRLLERAPANSADELRLALLRASYRAAEKIAENHRLRLASEAEVEQAEQAFSELIPQFTTLRQQIKQNLDVAVRRQGRSTGAESVVHGEMSQRIQALYAQCAFLNAWALYYQSWLHARPDNAKAAEPLFAELLSAENSNPRPSEVSEDLRSTEPIARCILGMALCKSLTSSSATAISWVQLLEHENAFPPVREQAPVWRVAIHLEHREYQNVRDVLAQHYPSWSDAPAAWLRLIAVSALQEAERSRQAEELAREAVLGLAAKGELNHVLDLARLFGPEALGRSGFALRYVHGVMKYQKAREAHGGEAPTLNPGIVELYDMAAADLSAALAEQDAAKYAPAAAGCRRLIAWCLYFQSRFLEARHAFEETAKFLSGNDAAEALWMAIVSLDKVVEAGGDSESSSELADLTEQFLFQFPSSFYAPKLRLRRAVASKQISLESVEELLAIPPDSGVYGQAQRRAADMLYQLFREGASEARFYYANRFLTAAVPQISPASLRQIDVADPAAVELFVARCRQVLEVALADGIERPAAARAALQSIAEVRQSGSVDLSQHDNEIDCRRVQERLLNGDFQGASDIADIMWSRDQSALWTRIATRAAFRFGHRMWKRGEAGDAEALRGRELAVKFGGRVLHEFTDAAGVMEQPGALGYHAAVAEASMSIWESTGDSERGQAALFLYEKLLAARPRTAAFLRATAMLSQNFGKLNQALDCWRRLAAGTEVGAEPWFEAKYNLIQVMAQIDPQRAREVMNQHKQLNPEFGPEPWGSRLKALDEQIPASAAPAASAPDVPSPEAGPQETDSP